VVAAEAGRTSTYGGEKRVSKGEVLILAKNYIETLEKTRDELENSNSMLRQNVQQLKMDLVQRNGDAMPW
jgi:flagellar biosynthesis chaperone FliJ